MLKQTKRNHDVAGLKCKIDLGWECLIKGGGYSKLLGKTSKIYEKSKDFEKRIPTKEIGL